jgi:hypothetical protein
MLETIHRKYTIKCPDGTVGDKIKITNDYVTLGVVTALFDPNASIPGPDSL